ncbi:bifunctional nuclease family protein [Okibacterium endophyticum]
MVQVRVLGVALDATQQHIVLLKPLGEESGEGHVLPIWIGSQEASSILLAVSGEKAPRPLSHDLMKTLLQTLDTEVERVEVTRIHEGTFFAEIVLQTPSGLRFIDARPSDAVALAVRVEAPLFVADDVLDEAGIPAAMVDPGEHHDAEDDEQKLDEFKKFLEDVDPEDFQG